MVLFHHEPVIHDVFGGARCVETARIIAQQLLERLNSRLVVLKMVL